jgi:hypothetical protein
MDGLAILIHSILKPMLPFGHFKNQYIKNYLVLTLFRLLDLSCGLFKFGVKITPFAMYI